MKSINHIEETMYVTRPLSMYRKSPSMLEENPPEAPHSGYLVITDEDADSQDNLCWNMSCCGLCKRKEVKRLPFAQDKILTVDYTSEYRETTTTNVWFVPVLNQPLSANRYYVIRAKGRHRGKACTSSREHDIISCCFKDISMDKKPKPLNPKSPYQQLKIHRHHTGGFYAKSVAPDGIPPKFLKRRGWNLRCSSLNALRLTEAPGLDAPARARLPSLAFSAFDTGSARSEVGKWHCPFPFVRERGLKPKKQMKRSIFYTMTLEQRWEEIFSCGNVNCDVAVRVDVDVRRVVCLVNGFEAIWDKRSGAMSWFKVYNPNGRRGLMSVGLSYAIVEQMRWVLEGGGWVDGEDEVRVERVEESVGVEWKRFGCYVLVESFVLRRLDGSLVFKCSFRHTSNVRCKWE